MEKKELKVWGRKVEKEGYQQQKKKIKFAK